MAHDIDRFVAELHKEWMPELLREQAEKEERDNNQDEIERWMEENS